MTQEADLRHMKRALQLACAQIGRTGKNPAVGCVIVDLDGKVVSEAATGDGGQVHAEELALRALDGVTMGSTAYVTLEPCRQRSAGGRSCSERLIEAGIARVVCAIADPHPNGAGGFERLRTAGVQVDLGCMRDEAEVLYREFFQNLSS